MAARDNSWEPYLGWVAVFAGWAAAGGATFAALVGAGAGFAAGAVSVLPLFVRY